MCDSHKIKRAKKSITSKMKMDLGFDSICAIICECASKYICKLD